MNIEQLEKNIAAFDTIFNEKYPDMKAYEHLLGRMVKLSEEVGELSEAVLHAGGHQRTSKTDIDFAGEIADVIICTLLIAKVQNIDVWKALEAKLIKNNERFNISL